jgi:hypothetical protein
LNSAKWLTFERLKWCSFAHSTIYLCLLVCWIGGLDGPKYVFGWAHGIGWIIMCVLTILALHARTISMRIGVAVAIIGAIGPFVGSYEFIREERRRARRADTPARYSQFSDGS